MISLTKSQLKQATELLARGFHEYPEFVHTFPQESERAQIKPMFSTVLEYGLRYGEVYTTSSNLEGVAIWLSPQYAHFSVSRMLAAGAWKLPFQMNICLVYRYMGNMKTALNFQRHYDGIPYWYLVMIAVDPPYQGKGYAGDLIKPMLERIDKEKLPCYLETTLDKNVTLYQHYGFKVVETTTLPGSEIHFRAMMRDKAA